MALRDLSVLIIQVKKNLIDYMMLGQMQSLLSDSEVHIFGLPYTLCLLH